MIRSAVAADARAITAVQVRAWKRAYADFLPEEAVTEEAVQGRVERWRRGIAERGWPVLVFDLSGQVAGFVAVGASRDPDATAQDGALEAVYVDPPAQGAGVGRQLMDAGEAWLRQAGFADALLWVFTDNGLARDFYERRGWIQEPPDVVDRAHGSAWWAPALRYRLAL